MALFTAANIYADPVYLDCFVEDTPNVRSDFKVRLDESSGKVSHSDDRLTYNADGIWTADSVSYKHVAAGDRLVPTVIGEIHINRSTLKVDKYVIIVYPDQFHEPDHTIGPSSGFCTITEVAKKQF